MSLAQQLSMHCPANVLLQRLDRFPNCHLSRMSSSSGYGRKYVALPAEVCNLHTNPGLRSASALISSRRDMKPFMTSESRGGLDSSHVNLREMVLGHDFVFLL